ncbi:hypothetical protein HYDPIDRAFT_109981 [Hydnomerulius pinastri MD-312]|nr:hypothetical protein HYDPIDRAFT_109981 [Hydnomerulius pinastri MD-312]
MRLAWKTDAVELLCLVLAPGKVLVRPEGPNISWYIGSSRSLPSRPAVAFPKSPGKWCFPGRFIFDAPRKPALILTRRYFFCSTVPK